MPETDDLVKLSFFANIGKAITSARSLTETLEQVMEQIGLVFAPTYWSLLLKNHATGDLKFTVVIGSGVEKLKGQVLPKGTGIAGWIAETGNDVIIEDVSKDSRFDSAMDKLTNFKTESIIGVPLKSRDKVFGLIELINKLDGSHFTPLDLNLLKTIADFAAIAIEKAYYFKALKRVASIDSLTGLYNRRSFQRFLDREIERAKRSDNVFTVMMLDVDRFKEINDSYGHLAGDRVLAEIAGILQSNLRKADLICRFGGDEFIVIMPDVGLSEAKYAKERITASLAERNRNAPVEIEMSIGLHQGEGSETDEILQFVDEDLYDNKEKSFDRGVTLVEQHLDEFLESEY